MVVSRRSFIKRGSLLVLAGGVCLGSADRIFGHNSAIENGGPTQEESLAFADETAPFNYTKATFTPYVGTIFLIYSASSKSFTTTLIDVSDIGPIPDTTVGGRECFALKFRGSQTVLQNTYRIEHQVLGQFELFLVPAGKDKKGVYCKAVINRLNA